MLIGDSGEQDPEIYARILSERPEQIRHVFIRGVRTPTIDQPRLAATFANCPRDRNHHQQIHVGPKSLGREPSFGRDVARRAKYRDRIRNYARQRQWDF